MRRVFIVIIVLAAAAGGAYYYTRSDGAEAMPTGGARRGGAQRGGGGGGGGFPGGFPGGGGFGSRQPMTVEFASVKRADMAEDIVVVGNLIGAATVEALPKVAGRLESVNVRLGDRVTKGQTIA